MSLEKTQHKDLRALILAAGASTRMKSAKSKVLHELAGVALLQRVVRVCQMVGATSTGIVVGAAGSSVQDSCREISAIEWIVQKEPRGSGHAVQCAYEWLKQKQTADGAFVLIACGDTPLLSTKTIFNLVAAAKVPGVSGAVLYERVDRPFGYGRVVFKDDRHVAKIVEEKDATVLEKQIQTVNSGVYVFAISALLESLPQLKNDNAKKEFYLTDVIEILNRMGKKVNGVEPQVKNETMGINTKEDLARAQSERLAQIRSRWMAEGVTLYDPSTVYIEEDVELAADVVIFPGTILKGKTKVEQGAEIGPNCWIENAKIGAGARIRASFIYDSTVAEGGKVGPFAHIRDGAEIGAGARIGNFSEIKKSQVGAGSKVAHLSYIGDAELGEEINVGAGVITCNFDGTKKHPTKIGSKAFIGSNVNLVAPVEIGPGAIVGAGSTITKDVPARSLALERSDQIVKEGWADKKSS